LCQGILRSGGGKRPASYFLEDIRKDFSDTFFIFNNQDFFIFIMYIWIIFPSIRGKKAFFF